MGEVGPKIDSDTSQSTDSISFSQARAVFANSASMKEDETARSSKSNSPSPSTSRTKTNALDAGWTTQLDQHSGVNSAHEHASNGLAVAYHPGVHLNKCASGAYTIRSSELSTTHYDALSVGVEVHAINGEILRGLNEKEVANLLSGREGSLVSMVICTASMGFETTSLTLVRSFEMRGQSLVQCEGTSGNHYNKSGVHHSIAFSLSGDLDASPSLTEPVGANALRIKEETPAVADENVNIEQTSGVCREDKDATIVQSLSNDGDADDLQKPLSQLNLQDDLFHNGEEFIPNSVPLDPKPEDAKPNQDVVAQYFNPDIDVPQQFHSDNSVSQYFNPDSNVSQYLNSDNLVSQYLNSESSAPQRFNSDHDAVQSESVERRKNEVTLEQLIAIGVTDPEEQARILGTSVHSPQPASQPQVSLPLRSERADEDMEIRRAREVAQLIAIGVKDPVEQSQILGYDASLYWNPKPKPVESNPVKQQCSAPSSSPAAPEAARPPEDPAKQMKGQKQQEKPRVLGPAVVDMRSPIACGSFKNAYLGTMGDETILVLKHRGGGCEGNAEIQKEVAILGCISQHPHVVHCLGTFRYGDGGVCIALEWCKYGILSDWLAQKGSKVTVPQKHDIIHQVCRGMRHVASCKIIHRDLAAHNILIHNENPIVAKITDFGMAVKMGHPIPPPKPFSGAGSQEKEVIAVRWAAPEILRSQHVWSAPWSEKSDVWAFGVTAWQVYANGEVPFTLSVAESVVKVKVLKGSTLTRLADCTDDDWAMMTRCWTSDAGQRPTFSELCKQYKSDS